MISWLETLIDFLNKNSGVITGVATVVLVAITWWYVRLTKLMLKSTNTPVIRLFLHNGRYDNISLCVENIGIGFARDITFTGDLSLKTTDRFSDVEDKPLKELEPFKSGVDYLGPGHKIETYLFHQSEMMNQPEHKFDIKVTYKDLANIPDHETFTFEIGNWNNTDQFSYPHTDDTANAIEKVAQQLERMEIHRSGQNKLENVSRSIFQKGDPKTTALQKIADALERMSPRK